MLVADKSAPTGTAFAPSKLLLAALLLALTLLAYAPALRGELLLDDEVHVTPPELRSFAGLARIWTEVGATQQYYPVLHTAFWLAHRLWGDAVVGYHLVNVLLHVGAALLVVAIMRRLALPGAWLAAFVFALHPLHVESVAWIAEQKNTLSAVFALGAVYVYLGFAATRRRSSYALASALFLFALLGKTATAVLPAVLIVILWWQRSVGSPAFRRNSEARNLPPEGGTANHAVLLLPWFAAALAAGLITLKVERTLIVGIHADLSLTWLERVLVAGRALWFYAAKLIWPAELSFFYERWPVESASATRYFFPAAALGVATVLFAMRRTRPGAFVAFLIFAGTLFPVLGFFDVEWFVFSFVADHFVYLASIAPIVACATLLAGARGGRGAEPGVGESGDKSPPSKSWHYPSRARLRRDGVLECGDLSPLSRVRCVAAAFVIAALGVLTWRHAATFRDNVALYANAVARSPRSAVAHNHLGVALAKLPGREAAAAAAFERALQLNPHAAETHANLGDLLVRMPPRAAEGIAHLETALQLKPALVRVHAKLAAALAATPGRLGDAIAHYGAALEAAPAGSRARAVLERGLAEAHYNLGNARLRDPAGRAEAIAHYEQALRWQPDFVEAHANLGTALAAMPGRLRDAIAHFEAALRIDPDFAPARNNLARARQMLDAAPPREN